MFRRFAGLIDWYENDLHRRHRQQSIAYKILWTHSLKPMIRSLLPPFLLAAVTTFFYMLVLIKGNADVFRLTFFINFVMLSIYGFAGYFVAMLRGYALPRPVQFATIIAFFVMHGLLLRQIVMMVLTGVTHFIF